MSRAVSQRAVQIGQIERCLLAWLHDLEERDVSRVPRTYDEWRQQCVSADVTVMMALEQVCEVLPEPLQAPVRRLVAMRRMVWEREWVGEHREGAS